MIRKIKARFIVLSMTALFVLLFVIVAGMNMINYNTVVAEADNTLSFLSGNRGSFPDLHDNNMPKHMTAETPYESRYFSVLLSEDNQVIQADTSRIKAIDTKKAIEYAASAAASDKDRAFIGKYRFLRSAENGSVRIIFLDCGRKLDSFRNFLVISICMAAGGYSLFFFVILFFSGRIMKPVTESYTKQKQFITDAGHEIKTPLAIIQADSDVLEMEIGENEWLDDIQKQVRRLTALTNDLVCLSRMEETDSSLQMAEFSFSDAVSETAASFQALAQTRNKIFQCRIQPMVFLRGNEKYIRQLVSILTDNALKYSPQNGTISITVYKQGRQVFLTVFNTTENPIPKDKMNMIFERFYRLDSSRNTQTGGCGIGLSIAKAIVNAHGGKLYAVSKEENTLEITAQFPL